MRLVIALSCAALLLAACGGDRAAPPAASGAPAGRVLEVAGEATATRAAAGSPARRLAGGDPVYGDDTIATGADGRVVIELAHNGVRWTLEGKKQRRVDASAAWKAPKGAPAIADSLEGGEDDQTAAAGRHAEHEAAETAATAEAPAEAPAEAGEETAKAEEEPAPKPADRAASRGTGVGAIGTSGKGSGGGPMGPSNVGTRTAGGDEQRIRGTVRASAFTVDGGRDKAPTQRHFQRYLNGMKMCYETALRSEPQLAGVVGLAFTLDPAGKVASATIDSNTTGSGPLGSCVIARTKAAKFPEAAGITKVTVTLTFKPE